MASISETDKSFRCFMHFIEIELPNSNIIEGVIFTPPINNTNNFNWIKFQNLLHIIDKENKIIVIFDEGYQY